MAAEGPVAGEGTVILLNGVPRSGKSSIARALQAASAEPLLNLGVDATIAATPAGLRPGIGLRPGGERPDLEVFVVRGYRALFDSIAAHSRHGIGVASDLGIHESYSQPLGLWREAAERLAGLPVYLVGVRCTLQRILERRAAEPAGFEAARDGVVPDAVLRWERAVHDPGWYDLEVDTSDPSPADCAAAVLARVGAGPPRALDRHRAPR